MHDNIVASPQLSGQGNQKIEWVKRNMPILQQIEVDFREQQYFQGTRVLVCIHLEAKTAYLANVLASGGAEVAVAGSNPHSTKDGRVSHTKQSWSFAGSQPCMANAAALPKT